MIARIFTGILMLTITALVQTAPKTQYQAFHGLTTKSSLPT